MGLDIPTPEGSLSDYPPSPKGPVFSKLPELQVNEVIDKIRVLVTKIFFYFFFFFWFLITVNHG